jgi:hypothetical protein
MTVFMQFTPAASTGGKTIPAGPMEFFPSIDVALNEMGRRARHGKGLRAESSATERHTWSQWYEVRTEVAFPEVREGVDGWVALVWWRRGGQTPPSPGDPVGEIWLSAGSGRVERIRRHAEAWDTGRSRRHTMRRVGA